MKARSDSKLKTLPEDRQRSIAEYAQAHSLAETVAWLREDGLTTSAAALSEFLSWFSLRLRFQAAEQTSLDLIELLRRKKPELAESELQGWASEFFQLQAVQTGDASMYLKFASARFRADLEKEKLKVRQETLALQREKFQRETAEMVLKMAEDAQAREIVAAPGATHAQKIEQLGQLMFGEDWK